MNRRVVLALAVMVALAAFEAAARPGGGQGYSGGGSSGGSYGGGSSGGDDGAAIILLIELIIRYPVIGIPLAIVFIYIAYVRTHHTEERELDAFASAETGPRPPPMRRPGYEVIRARDPEFSAVLFEDFIYALYARVHAARASAQAMAALAPYVAGETRAVLLAREPAGVPIDGVVIGAMTLRKVAIGQRSGNVRVDLGFEANYTAHLPGGPQGYYVREQWSVERAADVQTRTREAAEEFRCPNCGAPFKATGDERCEHCGEQVGGGRFDWTLTHVKLAAQETRPPALTAEVQEQGTDERTIFDPDVRAQHRALIAEDPGAAPQSIVARLHAIYGELNAAWTARDLRRVRPYVSDALYNSLEYWIDAYQRQGLRNVLEGMAITRAEIVKVDRDRHYDAITLRFWASGLDYTVQAATGQRVSGSQKRPRRYSEYWTLIRGAAVRGAPRAAGQCPSCGAPLDRVNMAGTCEYCGAHMTRGEFDWVLSKIEQDDSYHG